MNDKFNRIDPAFVITVADVNGKDNINGTSIVLIFLMVTTGGCLLKLLSFRATDLLFELENN